MRPEDISDIVRSLNPGDVVDIETKPLSRLARSLVGKKVVHVAKAKGFEGVQVRLESGAIVHVPCSSMQSIKKSEGAIFGEVTTLVTRIKGVGYAAVQRQFAQGWTDAQIAGWLRREGFMPASTPDDVALEVVRQLRHG